MHDHRDPFIFMTITGIFLLCVLPFLGQWEHTCLLYTSSLIINFGFIHISTSFFLSYISWLKEARNRELHLRNLQLQQEKIFDYRKDVYKRQPVYGAGTTPGNAQ